MKVLNLVYPEKSDIKYTVQKFPDGQQNIIILDKNPNKTQYQTQNYIAGTNKSYLLLDHIVPVQIKSRLNNWLDLELIVCTVASLRELGVEEIHLHTPYIMGARSDRKFEEGGNNYVKHVIAPAINNLKLKSVTCIDPHSDVLEACINRFTKLSNVDLYRFAIREIYRPLTENSTKDGEEYILVSPDAGASKKIYKLAEQIGYKGDIITCSKSRDENGKLSKIVVPITNEQHNMLHKGPYRDFIIIDDICDGGATFINIAKEIKKYFHESGKTESKIYLIVTHGIFSKGFRELYQYFDDVYCTNSYQDIENLFFSSPIKQLNVF